MIKKRLRIHAKSLSEALAPSKKKLPPALTSGGSAGFCIYSRSVHCFPDFCLECLLWVVDCGCLWVCSFPLFRPPNMGYIGRDVQLDRENHPPFTCLDRTGTSSTTRYPIVGARPQANGTYRVGDYNRSPFCDPQSWDILGEGYYWTGRTTLPLPVLVLLVHPQPQDPPHSGRDPGPTRHIVSVIMCFV